jgi:geranylgeranyl pyrophosphate synthase
MRENHFSEYTNKFNINATQYIKSKNTDELLQTAMQYSLLQGGKRIRPLLVYATNLALNGNQQHANAPALAVEMIHSFSLIHDDLPALDNDTMRRGQLTCHAKFGEAVAILTGDALQASAFEVLSDSLNNQSADKVIQMIKTLALASGSSGMLAGQMKDIKGENQQLSLLQLERLHKLKTGALIKASIQLGILSTDNSDVEYQAALNTYADAIGLAFQIKDDLLDIQGDPSITGKMNGADLICNKATYPSIIGVDASQIKLDQLIDEAKTAITCIGPNTGMLEAIADVTRNREH